MAKLKIGPGSTRRRLRCGTMLTTGAALLAASLAGAAYARDDEEEEETERIVVTGSRLTNQFASDAPIDVISVDEAALEGVSDIASLLRTQTVASGSPQVTAATSSIFVQSGGVGAETLSLRGLGANRTLTLLNGRRAGPAGTRGAVSAFDLNVIPLAAIDRVEILKDGASSIYGSDAVAGVVNLITRQGDGGELNLFYSQPEESGGEEFTVNGSWGRDFDRGWIRFTGSYYDQTTLLNGERDYFACGNDYVFNPDGSRADALDPRTGEPNCIDLPWGHIWVYDYNNPPTVVPTPPWRARPALLQYDFDGDLAQYVPGNGPLGGGLVVPSGFFPVGYGELLLPNAPNDPFYTPFARASEGIVNADHPFQNEQSLIPDIERTTGFVNGEFELTPNVTMYAEVLLNRRKTDVSAYRQFWTYQYIYQYVYNYNYVYTYGDPLAVAAGFAGDFIGLSPTPPTDHADTRITVDYARLVGGLKGDFGARAPTWTWDVYGQFARSEGEYDEDIVFNDAIAPYQFRGDFCANTPDALTPVRGVPCVDINWYAPDFLNGVFTDEERAFLFGTAVGETIYEQWNIDGYLSGDVMKLPAGPVSAALGFQYRSDEIDDQPSQIILDGNAWNQSTAESTTGEQTTIAYFGEIGVPLLADKPLVERLDLTASVRYTDIESTGPVQGTETTVSDESTTYKVGMGWQVVPEVRFRGTYGTSFRSPALFELFLGNETGFLGQRDIDPCINWQANLDANAITQRIADNCFADGVPATHNGSGAGATIFSRGGALTNLQSETSDATTFGVVWTPGFANLQVAVDYFDINIEEEVTQLGAPNILLGCYDSLNFATEPLCDLFVRNPLPTQAGDPPPFLISTVQDDFVNIATQVNRGIDIELLYRVDTRFGMLTVGSQHSYQLEDEIELLPGSAPLDTNGMAGEPKWVGDLDLTLDRGPWSFFYGLRHVDETSNAEHFGDQPQTYFGQPAAYKLSTEAVTYHNASISRELPRGIVVRFGVSNIFDEAPPAVTRSTGEFERVGNSAFYSQYDWLGRRAFVNVTGSF